MDLDDKDIDNTEEQPVDHQLPVMCVILPDNPGATNNTTVILCFLYQLMDYTINQ